ncbi:CheR family methyltransferase [Bryobacter aggregatus]|uniref:CheR family methyltransferase n=1 Tax=Bryobacter aggregatus TaxID=360054 RepID=UPI00068E533F|nr:protein-glutamate O-methyltransferase CheR [Bryobacter aggregatus]
MKLCASLEEELPSPSFLDCDILEVIHKLKALTGISISIDKRLMIDRRIRKRMRELGCQRPKEYLQEVERDRAEQQTFINLLTTNETSFFRTQSVWEHFSKSFLPGFAAANPTRTLRIWSGASATGEEPFSIAMSCAEFRRVHPQFRFEITATDIDTEVLAAASSGYFVGKSIARLEATRPDLIQRYFHPRGEGFAVGEELKRQIRFQPHNLMRALHHPLPFDIVFLRNVLIYFEAPEQTAILRLVGAEMSPVAQLILGESESISRLQTSFRFLQPLVYQRTGER